MARQMKMTSAKRMNNRRTIQANNRYAVYMAKQESAEIDNALFTLNRILDSSQQKTVTRVTVRTNIVTQE